jgi:membrane AbrB-like protein
MSGRNGHPAGAWRRAASWPAAAQWGALVALSALISAIWGAAGLPAALLLGPMIGGIVLGVNGVRLAVPRVSYLGAQVVVGAMVSAAITPDIVSIFLHDAFWFSVVLGVTLLGAAALGWSISRSGVIPGATAVYGITPGAAGPMMLLGEAEGADVQVVAIMQYSRVMLVVLAVAFVARLWADAGDPHPHGALWLAPVHWGNLVAVLLLAALAQQAARLVRLPAWAVLGPMLVLSALHAAGWITIELPRWLLAAAYAAIGWHIGLGFRRDALFQIGRALPVVMAATLVLMALCALLAWCLTHFAHVDSLTAYLATSPGGLDSVAIIAASTPRVDLSFVLALQSVRLLFVIGLSPLITRLVVRHSPHLQELRPSKT